MEISMEQNQLQQRQGGNNGAFDEDGRIKRTGSVWTASAHIITAVIDTNILLLPWIMAQLGWVAGPILIILSSFVVAYTSCLLAECYRTGDPITGQRNYTYTDAVHSYLGAWKQKLCGFIQYVNLFAAAIAFTSESSHSMMAIRKSDCFHEKGDERLCLHISSYPYIIVFGVIQIVFSQIPDFDRVWWLSSVASVMSFTFSFIAIGLAVAQVIKNGGFKGSLTGISSIHQSLKIWDTLTAIGGIVLNYSYSIILIEIQDTIKAPPPSEAKVMKKATFLSVAVITFFNMLCGCIGYAAFGDSVSDNLFTENDLYNPFWLLNIANIAIVIHLVGAYQLFSQPIFAFFEKWANRKWPNSKFISKKMRIPFSSYKLKLFRLVWRSAFVVVTTVIPLFYPLFYYLVILLSLLGYWPLTFYFPVEMYVVQKKVTKWSFRWMWLYMPSFACLLVSLAFAVAAVAISVYDFKLFQTLKSGA